MGVEAVNDVEVFDELRGLFRQVCSAAAADDEDVNFVLPVRRFFHIHYRDARGGNLDGSRVAAGEDRHQFHVAVCFHGALHPAAQVAVAQDTDSDAHKVCSFQGLVYIVTLYNIPRMDSSGKGRSAKNAFQANIVCTGKALAIYCMKVLSDDRRRPRGKAKY